jgi:tetratricopeptide (TPR) repeat protein
VKAFAVLPLFLALQVLAEDPRVTSLVKQGDGEERKHHARAALACFRAAEKIEPENVGVLLRISKQFSDLIAETSPEPAAHKIADQALEYALRAVELDPNNAKGRLNLAVSYGRLTDFVGNKTKLEYSKIIRDEALKSIELDPNDDFAWHVLGRWHFGVTNVNGVLKVMAGLVYGGMPKASNEEAAKFLKKAAEIAPQRIIHHAELARVYKAMGRADLAAKQWQTVLALPGVDREDEKEKKEAQLALGTTNTGPGRSAAR